MKAMFEEWMRTLYGDETWFPRAVWHTHFSRAVFYFDLEEAA